jgi:hypothetical protein
MPKKAGKIFKKDLAEKKSTLSLQSFKKMEA